MFGYLSKIIIYPFHYIAGFIAAISTVLRYKSLLRHIPAMREEYGDDITKKIMFCYGLPENEVSRAHLKRHHPDAYDTLKVLEKLYPIKEISKK